jgi:preprotein translocase subunit SecG
MYTLLLLVFLVVCFALTIVILLQSSKGGGLAGAFGGGGADMGAVFGGRGAASFLSKATAWLAFMFLALSLILSLIGDSTTSQRSLIQEEQQNTGSVPAAGLPMVPSQAQPLPIEIQEPAVTDSTAN